MKTPFRSAIALHLLLLAACGGSSSSSTSSPSSSTPTGPTTVTSGLYTFTFDAATSAGDRQLIQDAVLFADGFFRSTLGRTIAQSTTISTSTSAGGCANGGSAAFTGTRTTTYCIANAGWTQLGPNNHQKIVIHETYHLLQFEQRWLGTASAGANWVIEGAAEYVGWRGLAAKGVTPFDTARGCMVKEDADFDSRQPPGLPNLSALETQQSFQTTAGPLYPHSMIGIDELLTTPGIGALNTYGDAIAGGTPWPSAFQTAFGTTSAAFYAQYPPYRASLAVPAAYQCGG